MRANKFSKLVEATNQMTLGQRRLLIKNPAARPQGMKSHNSFNCTSVGLSPCFLMYRSTISQLPRSPSVATQYPSVQNSPPYNSFLSFGNLLNTSRAVILFVTRTSCPGAHF